MFAPNSKQGKRSTEVVNFYLGNGQSKNENWTYSFKKYQHTNKWVAFHIKDLLFIYFTHTINLWEQRSQIQFNILQLLGKIYM
jgi:hypothetical protein